MLPRSGWTADRISVARSITCAIFSKPSQIFRPLTDVSIAGNVLSISLTGKPTRKGSNRFGSNVSGAAMPPPIQIRMQASAVGDGFSKASFPSPRSSRGAEAAMAAADAAAMDFRKSRRTTFFGATGSISICIAAIPGHTLKKASAVILRAASPTRHLTSRYLSFANRIPTIEIRPLKSDPHSS